MRKYILSFLVCLVVVMSCQSDSVSDSEITPPAWAIGLWVIETSPTISTPFCRIKADDYCSSPNYLETCYSSVLELASEQGQVADVVQVISDDEYKLTVNVDITSTTHHFIRISSTEIEYVNQVSNGLPNTPLVRQ